MPDDPVKTTLLIGGSVGVQRSERETIEIVTTATRQGCLEFLPAFGVPFKRFQLALVFGMCVKYHLARLIKVSGTLDTQDIHA